MATIACSSVVENHDGSLGIRVWIDVNVNIDIG
jgi:hypothetical protein